MYMSLPAGTDSESSSEACALNHQRLTPQKKTSPKRKTLNRKLRNANLTSKHPTPQKSCNTREKQKFYSVYNIYIYIEGLYSTGLYKAHL